MATRRSYSRRVSQVSVSDVTVGLRYKRVSSDDQADTGVSLAAQETETVGYIARAGWELGPDFSDILSGTKDDRPGYQALLAKVRELRATGRSVVVVVAALDRFGRRLAERVRSREEFKSMDVETHSVREGGLVNDMVAGFLAVMAEEEVKRLGMRVKASQAEIRRGGWYLVTPNIAWGFVARPATAEERAQGAPISVLEVDPATAPYVVEAFQRCARGDSTRSIARWASTLTDEARGLRFHDDAARAELRHKPVRSKVRGLSLTMLQGVLRNPVYAQRDVWDSPERTGRWVGLVDDQTWFAVQTRLDGHAAAPRGAPESYLLSGIVTCAKCGARAHGETHPWRDSKGEPQLSRRYRCNGPTGANSCTETSDTPTVDRLVREELGKLVAVLAKVDASEVQAEFARRQRPAPEAGQTREVKRLERQVADHKRRVADAARKLVDGSIDQAVYEALIGEEREAMALAQQELGRLTRFALVSDVSDPRDIDAVLTAPWARIMAEVESPALVRDVLLLLIDSVTPRRIKRGQYSIELRLSKLAQSLLDAATAVVEAAA